MILQNKRKINFLVVDDHPLVCTAISHMLEKQYYSGKILSVNNSHGAMKLLKEDLIDFILLDIYLLDSDGFEFLRRAKAYGYKGKVLFISAHKNKLYSETAFKLGANGYVTKGEDLADKKKAIETIIKGYSVFKTDDIEGVTGKSVKLSKREVVVFNYLIQGLSNKQIAEILSLSSKTISTYKTRIFEKYQVGSIVELMKVESLAV